MKYYIDYENVNSVGLDGVETLTENDEIHIYFSGTNMTMKMDYVAKLLETKAKIVLEHVQNGTANALDFQMIVNIFCDIEASDSYVIVSRDKGYDAAINAGKRKGFGNGFRAESIRHFLNRRNNIMIIERKEEKRVEAEVIAAKEEVKTETAAEIVAEPVTEPVTEMVAETVVETPAETDELAWVAEIVTAKCEVSLESEEKTVITEALEKARGKYAKNQFYQHFVSKFGAKEGRDFYAKIKPAYEELRKCYRALHAAESR